ncbi:MAG: type IV pilus twitching motility protein PilT [Holophagales bacterium]|nr:MAG: type IV pilus twitching motility protein PilT [Holophagales bacterium]
MGDLFDLLRYTVEQGGSDLHLAAGMEPRVRRHGLLEAIPGWPTLDHATLSRLLPTVVSEKQWQEYVEHGDLDLALGLPGVARFRVNFLRQERGAAAVFRVIPERIMSLEELGFPPAISNLADLRAGLVLVTGPTGSGKSTTLAAVIHRINIMSSRHIVTIEDPVEFVHQNRRSVFSQRELGTNTESFASALRSAIRQDADVILVGEMRDLETVSLALKAAEMGALVFGTLHTSSAAKTIDRLIDVFPSDEQEQARLSLSESLVAIIAQHLLPRLDGSGRIAALEILLKTSALPSIVREGNLPMIQNLIQGGRNLGMIAMDDSLFDLVDRKLVSPHDAYLKAQDKSRFEPLLGES